MRLRARSTARRKSLSPGGSARAWFEREVVVGEAQLLGFVTLSGKVGEDRPIGEIGLDGAAVEHLQPLFVRGRVDDLGLNVHARQCLAQALFGSGAGEDANLLPGQRGKIARLVAAGK